MGKTRNPGANRQKQAQILPPVTAKGPLPRKASTARNVTARPKKK